jgi:hypothetical protein
MFRLNARHLQMPIISSITELPESYRERLAASWAGTFYQEFFMRLDEAPFAVLYSDKASRPNIPVNRLVSLEFLKAGHGWSDEELYDALLFNVQVRYALGLWNLGRDDFELRTVYNFRHRLTQHMQQSGENLLDQAFEHVTDVQLAAFDLKTDKQRMDSTFVASNIRDMSRLQLLVEVLQRVHRMLSLAEQARYGAAFAPYLKGSAGQYVYRVKSGATAPHLQAIGELMQQLVAELTPAYAQEATYQMLVRVLGEHFVAQAASVSVKPGQDISAASLQSPDDPEATCRTKAGETYKGYVANVTETCHPENPLQLIVKVQTAPNITDDGDLFAQAVPALVARTELKEAHTDGGYNGQAADAAAATHDVIHIQSAIRGAQPSAQRVALAEFEIAPADRGTPDTLTCPQGQTAPVRASRKHLKAAFDINHCSNCPLFGTRCPVDPGKHRQHAILRFSQHQIDVARRRKRCTAERASEHHLRPAIEATVRSVKHPFPGGKLPVRGRIRISMLLIGSCAMTNVRRIHRYVRGRNHPMSAKPTAIPWPKPNQPGAQPFRGKLETPMHRLLRWFQGLTCPMPSWLPWAVTP